MKENDSCVFLNDDLLCDIYTNIGEDKLCETCKSYPRITKRYDDVYEQNLTLSCPEVAKILVSNNEIIEFCFAEYDDNRSTIISSTKNDVLFNSLVLGRGLSVDIMQLREIPLWKRTFLCITIAGKIQNQINKKQLNVIRQEIELFQNDNYLNSYLQELKLFPTNIILKIEQYMLLINSMQKLGIINKIFFGYMNETIKFLNEPEIIANPKLLEEVIMSFEKYNKKKEFIYENYMVYHLFHYYMPSYEKGDLLKHIVMMVEGYSLMKLYAAVRWYNNGYQLSDDEQVEILYSYSRTIEHRKDSFSIIYNAISEKGYSTMPYLVNLII